MPAPRIDTVQAWPGRTMIDPAGSKIGTIADIYLDDDTGQPEWATVTTGLFGTKQSFVPLDQAEAMGDSVQVPYDKDRVRSAPGMQTEDPTASMTTCGTPRLGGTCPARPPTTP